MQEQFTVNADEISIPLLIGAGYQIIHVPYFAMYGRTRTKWQLDADLKTAFDAAHKDAVAISFQEYCARVK